MLTAGFVLVKIRRKAKLESKPLRENSLGDILFFKRKFIISMFTVKSGFWIYIISIW